MAIDFAAPRHFVNERQFAGVSMPSELPGVPEDLAAQELQAMEESANLFGLYKAQRHVAGLLEDATPEELKFIREDTGAWFEATNQQELTLADRMSNLTEYLLGKYGDSVKRLELDLAATSSLLGAVSVAPNTTLIPDMVSDLGDDINVAIPILRYLPDGMNRAAVRGMPESIAHLVSPERQARRNGPMAKIKSLLSRFAFSLDATAQDVATPEVGAIYTSRGQFEDYFSLRFASGKVEKIEGAALREVQEDVRSWLARSFGDVNAPGTVEDYRTYSADTIRQKIGGLVKYLRENHADKVDLLELWSTEAFMQSAFSMYEERTAGEALTDRDGSFAFVVPARMSRNYPMYGQEVEPVIPALRYVPNELRAWIMRGCPPFIIDTYQPGPDGKRGYLVYAPVTEDMRVDLSSESNGAFMGAAQEAVNDAVDFAHNRLGVEVVGLGATLPMVTFLGKTVRQRFGEDVIVTTGHGGTVELICATIDANTGEIPKSVGILGLGSIGASAAVIASERYDGVINVYDPNYGNTKKLMEAVPGRFTEVADEARLIAESEVVISAITARYALDLDKIGVGDMHGKLVVDDSQPASMDPRQVRARGGRYLWVIGQDGQSAVKRTGYDYGTMLSGTVDLFGCEAEAAVLAAYYRDLKLERGMARESAKAVVGHLAITGPVTAESAGLIGRLFEQYGIIPAKSQAFGRSA